MSESVGLSPSLTLIESLEGWRPFAICDEGESTVHLISSLFSALIICLWNVE